jgi:hypothetical protein
MRIPGKLALLPLSLALCLGALPLPAQEEEEAPQVVLEGIVVDPATPAADTLCKLRVLIRNAGDRIASQFGFTVTVNDVELPVYVNQLFMYPAPPGETTEIPLYNFWSTETSRPAPEDGKLRVEVVLREAEWMKIEMEDDVEVWTPLGAVEGLPSTRTVTLSMGG